MDEKNPKRRKDKYNPYTISEQNDKFYIEFKDGEGVLRYLEISRDLYDAFNEFELHDLAMLNEWDRNIEHSELTEESLVQRSLNKPETVEVSFEHQLERQRLRKFISELSAKQRRRIEDYYFKEMTYEQIAREEGCSIQAVAKSVTMAEKKIKEFLEKN